jgi:cell shape-determining protein MreC
MPKYAPLLLVLALLSLLTFPQKVADGLRSMAVATVVPVWKGISWTGDNQRREEIAQLELENHSLRQQIVLLKNQIDLEKWVGDEIQLLKKYDREGEFGARRREEMERLLQMYTQARMARVVFREAACWASALWINIGRDGGVEKQSPVVLGNALVGVVDYVGKHRARVRLMTDASVTPSVRILREGNRLPILLAKGEICGVRTSNFGSCSPILRGVGFNYDFEDEEGPPADKVPLLQIGDLLVTTGLDGVFPAGLRVGHLLRIYPLGEGACTYEIDATAVAGDFNEMTFVTVLPPLQKESFFVDSNPS